MKKFYISLVVVVAAAIAVLLLGDAFELWQISSNADGLLGLAAIVPAAVWIFFKGLNPINTGLYIGGIDYILFKKFLTSFGARAALLIAEAVLIVVWIIIIYLKKSKELENTQEAQEDADEQAAEEAESVTGGTNG